MKVSEPSQYDPNYVPKKVYLRVGQKALLFNAEGKFLALKRSKETNGNWSLPGGDLELDEDPTESIIREIKEETQLEVSEMKPYCAMTFTSDDGDFCLALGYTGKVLSGLPKLNWEHDGYRWVTKEELLQLNPSVNLRKLLDKI